MTGSLAALLLAASLAACAGDPKDQPTTLPPITATPTPTPTSNSPTPLNTTGMSDEQQIRAVYEDMTAHYYEVADLAGESRRREAYSRWAIDAALRTFARGSDELSEHETYSGRAVAHIVQVDVKGRKARVYDCGDESHVFIKNVRSGKLRDPGESRIRLIVDLRRTVDGWRVARSSSVEGRCTRTPS